MHGAADMLAPRNTPVHAVENGRISKLFNSKRGGLTVYEADPSGRFVYYYAHLEKYADNIHDGDAVKKGEVIGYVGTSGNAPPNTPHLHFSIGLGDATKKWWVTSSVDPYEVFK
ncbi:MAG: M23 family metallopeptidase [Cyanobacteria bacterium SZAS-4]|nr:M23 family metallopeptidase [Cyanobacteria bacterium SZAS-4]